MMFSAILAKADNFYAEASAIWVDEIIEDIDDGYGGTLEAGYAIDMGKDGWQHRLGLEVGWLTGDDSETVLGFDTDIDTDIIPLLVNYSLVFPITENAFSGYVGAGIGVSFVDTEVKVSGLFSDDETDEVFTYQAFAGVNYSITESTYISIGARYIGAEDADILGEDYDVFGTLAVELTLGFSF